MKTPRIRAALAVVVAAGLFEHARRCSAQAKAWKLVRMAADAIDHTRPDPQVIQAYHYKPAEMGDARFLAQHLALIEPLQPDQWPARKIRARDWGEFTRVMQGLDEALGLVAPPKEAPRNREALAAFVLEHIAVLETNDQNLLRQYLAAPEHSHE